MIDEYLLDTIFTKAGTVLNDNLARLVQYTEIAQGRIEATSRQVAKLESLKDRYQVVRLNRLQGTDEKVATVASVLGALP